MAPIAASDLRLSMPVLKKPDRMAVDLIIAKTHEIFIPKEVIFIQDPVHRP
jgi:hypothetical protein